MTLADRRLLLVHAHPDDESISTAATMAKYAAEGAQVTLVTCTLGEEGEILTPEIAHYASDQEDRLGQHRITELADAMRELGVTDHRFLGGAGKYRDSGMVWGNDGLAQAAVEVRPDSFWATDLLIAAADLVQIIREVQPQVLVTYDEFGGYGHPDHIQAHRVAMYAVQLAAVDTYRPDFGSAWTVDKVYWTAMSATAIREGLAEIAESHPDLADGLGGLDSVPPMAIEDDQLDARIDGSKWIDQKFAAMKAHRSQITSDGPFFSLPDDISRRFWAFEYFKLVVGTAGETSPGRLEDDLFSGVH